MCLSVNLLVIRPETHSTTEVNDANDSAKAKAWVKEGIPLGQHEHSSSLWYLFSRS